MTRLFSQKKSKHAKFPNKPFGKRKGERDETVLKHPPLNAEPEYVPVKVPEKFKLYFLIMFGLMLIVLAFFFNSPREIWDGNIKILTSPANLLTDYIKLTNIGATLFNAGVLALISIFSIKATHSDITGILVAAVFTVTGFSFFGKNLLNSIPIFLGVYLFAKIVHNPPEKYLVQALFGTALGPLVSEIAFNIGLPIIPAVLLGFLSGVFVGFILQPLASHFKSFHMGFSLYNVGFTAGIIGMVFLAVLRGLGIEVLPVSILSAGNNRVFTILLVAMFTIMLVFGLFCSRWSLRGFKNLLKQGGTQGTDLIELSGFGPTLINMALLGYMMTAYVLIMKGQINGPVIGGIFTVVGFGAAGKNVKNVLPIILGVFIANLMNIHEHNTTVSIVSALFGTTLAPIAGVYGVGWGIIAGFLHMALTMNISYLHGGMNLYNNGFSGGFVAAVLVPLIENGHNLIKKHMRKE